MFALGRNVFVACDEANAVALRQISAQFAQRVVLRLGKYLAFQSFQFNADRVVIAVVASAPVRAACMPRALVAIDELGDCPMS